MDADRYCRDKVAAEGSTLYYCLLFADEPSRGWITAARALGEELREVADQCSDLNVGRSKLAWWHEECTRALEGEPRHPVTAALTGKGSVEKHRLMALLDGALKRLQAGGSATRAGINDDVAAAPPLGALVASGFADTGPPVIEFAEKLYAALGQAWIARLPRLHGWRSFTYLPADELARAGVSREHLYGDATSDALAGVIESQVNHARGIIERALTEAPGAPAGFLLPALAEARMELANLNLIRRRDHRVLERPPMITPLRKLWIAWRTARRVGD